MFIHIISERCSFWLRPVPRGQRRAPLPFFFFYACICACFVLYPDSACSLLTHPVLQLKVEPSATSLSVCPSAGHTALLIQQKAAHPSASFFASTSSSFFSCSSSSLRGEQSAESLKALEAAEEFTLLHPLLFLSQL